jgi:hypothetical protein
MLPDAQTTLDQLWSRTSTYQQSQEYLDTLRFVAAMHEFSPYNAFLLRLQRPHLRLAATADRWKNEFGRWLRTDKAVRPLVVLRPFGPVDFVFDLEDTEGPELPRQVLEPFYATGRVESQWWERLMENMLRRGINVGFVPGGLDSAGQVTRLDEPLPPLPNRKGQRAMPDIRFLVELNRSHGRTTQFVTLLHELAHVTCGHLGARNDDDWNDRQNKSLRVVEFEAESVAFLVCSRLGLETASETYLVDYVGQHGEIPSDMSITTVFTAAWLLEEWTRELSWPKKPKRQAAQARAHEERRRVAGLTPGDLEAMGDTGL